MARSSRALDNECVRGPKLAAWVIGVAGATAAILVLTRPDDRRVGRDPAVPSRADVQGDLDDRSTARTDTSALEVAAPRNAAAVEPIDTSRQSITAEPARITGTLLFGEFPASGASVELSGPVAMRELVTVAELATVEAELLVEKTLIVGRASSGSDGSFELHALIERPRSYLLVAQWQEHRLSRRVVLSPGKGVDLAELRFPALARILGRVVDLFEELPRDGIWVQVRRRPGTRHSFIDSAAEPPRRAWVDPETRKFVLDDIRAGQIDLVLGLAELPEVQSRTLLIEAGETHEFELRYSGRGLRNAAWVRFHPPGDPTVTLEQSRMPARQHVRLQGEGRVLGEPIRYRGTLLFRDVEPGSYDLIVDDPRFASIGRSGMQPGRGIAVPITGNAAVQLEVRDAGTGSMLTSYEARLVGRDPRSPYEIVQQEGRPLPDGGMYAGIVSEWDSIVIAAHGKGQTRIALDGLKPYETLAIRATLGARRRVEGRVVDAAGRGVGGAEVHLREMPAWSGPPFSPEEALSEIGGPLRESVVQGAVSARARSDPDGNFSIEDARSGPWIRTVSAGSYACKPGVLEVPESDLVGLEIVVRGSGVLRGRFLLPVDSELPPCRVVLIDPDQRDSFEETMEQWGHDFLGGGLEILDVAKDGEFRSPTILAGDYTAILLFDDETEVRLGTVTVDAGGVTERTFDVRDQLRQAEPKRD